MNSYNIKYAENGFSWEDIPRLKIQNVYKVESHGIEAYAQIVWSNDAFLVHLWTIEPETPAESFSPFDYPSDDSCLEFFFSPIEGNRRYINIEFNSVGCCYFGLATGKHDLVRIIPQTEEDVFSKKITKWDNGWEIYYSVPFELIKRFFENFEPFVGKKIRANCYKCAVRGNYPHYLTWNPDGGQRKSFHNPDIYGEMILTK